MDAEAGHALDQRARQRLAPQAGWKSLPASPDDDLRDMLAALPLAMVFVSPPGYLIGAVAAASLASLALLGAIGAQAGGANWLKGAVRVTFWGAAAMAITAGIGAAFGTTVA